MAEATKTGLAEAIRYIETRTVELQRYTDKLRTSLVQFAKLFGPKRECAVHDLEHTGVGYNKAGPECRAKIEIPFDLKGEVFTYYSDDPFNEERSWRLVLQDHELLVVKTLAGGSEVGYDFGEAPRAVLKEIVKTGALQKFLQQLKDKLDVETQEYEAVAEIAAKIASAVSS